MVCFGILVSFAHAAKLWRRPLCVSFRARNSCVLFRARSRRSRRRQPHEVVLPVLRLRVGTVVFAPQSQTHSHMRLGPPMPAKFITRRRPKRCPVKSIIPLPTAVSSLVAPHADDRVRLIGLVMRGQGVGLHRWRLPRGCHRGPRSRLRSCAQEHRCAGQDPL